MKLRDQITRRELFVAFGTAQSSGGLSSVDLAATRDDSQVIVTASDGSAAPIAGADASTAGVMTAADKDALDRLAAGTMRAFETRAAVALAGIDGAVTLVRTAGHAAAGDGGGALYKRVGAEPAHALKVQSADGAWWEIAEPIFVTFQACGGVEGDDSANGAGNVAAFDAFMSYLQDRAAGGVVKGPSLVFPVMPSGGSYHFNSHLNVKAVVHITGPGGWFRALRDAGPRLVFPAGSHGLIVHRTDTIDDTTGAETYSADGSIIENVALIGGGNDQSTGHGIWLRARATLRHLYVREFAEHGYYIPATQGGGGSEEGNVNLFKVENCTAERNGRSGFFTDFADGNAGHIIGCNGSFNGRAGFWDSSFLGNTYMACHASGNGVATRGGNGSGESSIVHFNVGGTDKRWLAALAATEADLVATQPGTNSAVWIEVDDDGPSSFVPTWQSGQPEGTYFVGGPYITDNSNAHNLILNCYSESDYPQYVLPTIVIGGHMQHAAQGTFLSMRAGANDAQIITQSGLIFRLDGDTAAFEGDVLVDGGSLTVEPISGGGYIEVADDENHATRLNANSAGNSAELVTDRGKLDILGFGIRQGSGLHDVSVRIRDKGQFNDVVHTAYDLAQLRLVDGVAEPATVAGVAQLFVDGADGDLKVKFGDGTLKTIAADA